MLALIDRKLFCNAVSVLRIIVLQASLEFFQSNGVRPVSIDLVGGHVDERGLGAGAPCSLEQMQGAERIYLKVQKRNGGRTIVRRLGRGVDNQVRAQFVDESQQLIPLTDVESRVPIAGDLTA